MRIPKFHEIDGTDADETLIPREFKVDEETQTGFLQVWRLLGQMPIKDEPS
jgi:hypothetical protein